MITVERLKASQTELGEKAANELEALARENAELKAKVAELEKDKARLDWLENPLSQNAMFGRFVMGGSSKALRVAIDASLAAMKGQL